MILSSVAAYVTFISLVVLEDTSWSWPWMTRSWPWPWEKSWPYQGHGQDFSPKTQATWLLYVYALLKLTDHSVTW